jgi:PAS domain S-box-containing protein
MVYPADRSKVETAVQTIRETKEPTHIEFRTYQDEGARWVESQIEPVLDEDGSVTNIIGLTREITERKEREQDLKEADMFIEQALDALHDIFYVVSPDGGLHRWNDRLPEKTGFSSQEIANMEVLDFFPEDEQERIAEAIEETLTDGQATVEAELLAADGNSIPHEFTGAQLISPDGEVTGLVGIGREITERKHREHALERLHEATRELMTARTTEEVATIGSETASEVLGLSQNGIHLYNPEEETLDPIAWEDESTVLNGSPPAIPVKDSLAGQAYQTGESESYTDLHEVDERLEDETDFRSEVYLPLGNHGVFLTGSTSRNDIDPTDEALAQVLAANIETALDRVAREQELTEQNERLDKFTSVVSHDLRNPLNVAIGRLELAQQEVESKHLNAVDDALTRMDTLIDDLLEFAHEGEDGGETQPIDLAEIVGACWQNVVTGNATLTVDVDKKVQGYPGRLKQLLENLLRNAIEHGGNDVNVTVGELNDGFYVADDGPGIPEKERGDVFTVGYSTTTEGTGFGLNIVQEVASTHGWEVTVTDSETGGTRFEITGVESASN